MSEEVRIRDGIELASARKRLQELDARKNVLSAHLAELREVLAGTRPVSELSSEMISRFVIDVKSATDRFLLRGIEDRLVSLARETDAKIFKLKELLAHAAICPRCNGSGSIVKERVERDPDNAPVTHTVVSSCLQCGGSGKAEAEMI
jgi:hypothetical protein